MNITREELERRLEQRRSQERQAFANFNAARGAVLELEQLLLLLLDESGGNQEEK